jgi:phosphate transport system substrate-binding protein
MKMRTLLVGLMAGIVVLSAPDGGMAATAHIVTVDGTVISGEIISLENGIYTIRTPYGTITVPAAQIRSIDTGAGTPPPLPTPTVLRLAGSTTVGDELAPALLEAYSASKGAPDVTWTQEQEGPTEQLMEGKGPQNATFTAHLSRHGSGTAFTALADNKADIGMASRRITDEETAKLASLGQGDYTQPGQENVLALDGVLVMVNKSNPVSGLSISQIRDIFAGKITDWGQIGGPAGPIHPIGRDTHSGTYDTFNSLVMAGAKFAANVAALDGSDAVSEKVQGDPGGIGYVGFAYLGSNKALNIATECGLSFPASALFVGTEEYPLSRRLFLYVPASPANSQTRNFIDFALSGKGQQLAEDKKFISLEPQIAPVAFGRDLLAVGIVGLGEDKGAVRDDLVSFMNYARRVVNGNRLTTTFRFQFGKSALDSRAVRDIDRLADFLKSPAAAKRNVLVAGFADSVGSSARNRILSQQRAEQIADLLRAKGVQPNDVTGFGRVAPVACNSVPEGREKNRRVEIWLY